MRKVLPRTEANMYKYLPILTLDRYKDVRIDPESYRIEVYDEEAGEYRPKNVFSGGARDQFSLALRLSFAMATLPEERGTMPAFIFLDEPLSSFDEERKNALIQLVTQGEIAQVFDQVFIISHLPELAEAFPYRLRLEEGRIAECNFQEGGSTQAYRS